MSADKRANRRIRDVYGMSDAAAQSFMPGPLWFAMLLLGLPVLIFYPTHRLLLRYAGVARRA